MGKYRLVSATGLDGPNISEAQMSVLAEANLIEVEAPFEEPNYVYFEVSDFTVEDGGDWPHAIRVRGLWGHYDTLPKEDQIPGEIVLPYNEKMGLGGALSRLLFSSSRFF